MLCVVVLILWLVATTGSNDVDTNSERNINSTTSLYSTSVSDHNLSSGSSNCKDNESCGRFQVCYKDNCTSCEEFCASGAETYERYICKCNWWLTDEELKVVAQAVLGIAVFVTFVALGSLLWKICARRLRRHRAASAVDLLDDSASLTSEQVFVVERLRDRPPCYEDAARDFAVEKPPAYSQVVAPEEVSQHEQRHPAVSVSGIPVTLVGVNLTARDFVAPPPYSESHQVVLLTPPPIPPTPPVQRLRRCVRKVVVIRRIGRSIPSLQVCSSNNSSSSSSNNTNNTSNNNAPKEKSCNQNDGTFIAVTNVNGADSESFRRKPDTSVLNAILPESREMQNEIVTGQSGVNSILPTGKTVQGEIEESENNNNTFTTN